MNAQSKQSPLMNVVTGTFSFKFPGTDADSRPETRKEIASATRWKEPAGIIRRKVCTMLSSALDVFTITVSIADIATDMFVLCDFFKNGHSKYFQASLAIFTLAQSSYAFLFSATFASHLRPRGRVAVFLAVLPFAQLVPLFTWLESLHLESVDRFLRRMHLTPTSASTISVSSESGDSVWDFLQSKYQSHAGFLVEAFVEAVPQSVLQTVFAVLHGHSSALNTVSIAISIFTIASKGYLVSYALDVVTFVFNFMCIITDCLGLFASATIVATHGMQSFSAQVLVTLAGSGLMLSIVGGYGLLWFANLDDHLKLRKPSLWPYGVRGVSRGALAFDLYIQRTVAWFLAIIPCVVTFAGARLALLPICVFKSIDPDLVRHARFYRCLSHFLQGSGGGDPCRDARFWTANLFIARARGYVRPLVTIRQTTTPSEKVAAVRRWAACVGTRSREVDDQNRHSSSSPVLHPEEDDAMQRAILASLVEASKASGSNSAIAMSCSHLRRLRIIAWMERALRNITIHLSTRSEIFRAGCCRISLRRELRISPFDVILRVSAICALICTLLCAVPLAIGHAIFVSLGVVFPLLFVVVSGSNGLSSELSWYLTMLYSVMLLLVASLFPFVARAQLLWMDLADLHGFPDAFYSPIIVSEIRKRHLRDSFLRQRLGQRLSQHTLSFLEDRSM